MRFHIMRVEKKGKKKEKKFDRPCDALRAEMEYVDFGMPSAFGCPRFRTNSVPRAKHPRADFLCHHMRRHLSSFVRLRLCLN